MSAVLDTTKLADMLKSKRGNKGLRTVAAEIGTVSAPTLSRIEQGKVPDVDTFVNICKWLKVSTDFFIVGQSDDKSSNQERVVAHLRADKELNKDTVDMLVKMIEMAYSSK
ncbi:MAG: family transcriptional regulator [Mucilaginibacter sp.]|nr:family transcriptional regulator [Mucilaginibacter sp.]